MSAMNTIAFKTLATGSKGNCYLVSDNETELLLEAGITFKDIQKRLQHKTSKLQAVLVTHEHGDHAKAVSTFLERGFDVYMTSGTKNALKLTDYNCRTFTVNEALSKRDEKVFVYEKVVVGTFEVIAFSANHDAAEPVGFLIKSVAVNKTLLFLTDSYYSSFVFPNVNYFAVECNYDEETIETTDIPSFLKNRVYQSHMSLETAIEFFKAHDLSQCEQIYLLHISSGNANREKMQSVMEAQVQKPIEIVG